MLQDRSELDASEEKQGDQSGFRRVREGKSFSTEYETSVGAGSCRTW